jgi:membrane protease YdiL (CAAX protease family)
VISEKRWDTWSVIALGGLVFMSMAMAVALSSFAKSLVGSRFTPDEFMLLSVVVSLLCIQGAAVLWVHLFLKQNQLTWGEAFGFAQRNYAYCIRLVLLTMLLVFFGMVVLTNVSSIVLNTLYERLGWEWLEPQQQGVVQLLQNDWPVWLVALQGFTAIIVAPVGEELLFRGVLYVFIKQRGRPQLALWATSVLFALVHGNLAGFLFFIFLAMVLVAVYERTRNLFAPILLHSLFNAVNFTLIVSQPKWLEKFVNQ